MNSPEQSGIASGTPERPSAASRFAVLSFASGLVFCCPGTSLLALLMGALALLIGAREANASWRKFALGGMALGLASLCGLVTVYFVVHEKWEQEWRVLYTGPNNALYALDTGSLDGFRAEFMGPAADRPDAEIQAFQSELNDQLGRFGWSRSIRQSEPDLDGPGPWELGEYEAFFTKEGEHPWSGAIPVRIGINRLPSGTLRLEWVLIEGTGPHDEDVRIRYPARPLAEVPGG